MMFIIWTINFSLFLTFNYTHAFMDIYNFCTRTSMTICFFIGLLYAKADPMIHLPYNSYDMCLNTENPKIEESVMTHGETIEFTTQELVEMAQSCLHPEIGKKRDRNQAIIYLRKAATRGDTQAMSMLGRLLLDPYYSTYNPEEGKQMLQTAAEGGMTDNYFILSLTVQEPRKFECEGTFIPFATNYGSYINEDIFCSSSNEKPFYGDELSMLYNYSEIKGFSLSQLDELAKEGDVSCGILWAYRITHNSTSQNETELQDAVEYLRRESTRGYEMASLVLASHLGRVTNRRHEDKQFIISTLRERLSCLMHAYEQGVVETEGVTLATAVKIALLSGKIPEIPDELIESGLNYMIERAELKYDQSIIVIGNMYLRGFYVEKDETKGVEWLEKLALSGHDEACKTLYYYFSGEYAPPGMEPRERDIKKANYYMDLLWRYKSYF